MVVPPCLIDALTQFLYSGGIFSPKNLWKKQSVIAGSSVKDRFVVMKGFCYKPSHQILFVQLTYSTSTLFWYKRKDLINNSILQHAIGSIYRYTKVDMKGNKEPLWKIRFISYNFEKIKIYYTRNSTYLSVSISLKVGKSFRADYACTICFF